MQMTIVTTAEQWRIHSPQCRDIAREVAAAGSSGTSWNTDLPTIHAIVVDQFDMADGDDWRDYADVRVMPCVKGGLPAGPA